VRRKWRGGAANSAVKAARRGGNGGFDFAKAGTNVVP
jgi:hypothetical protein